MLSRVLLSCRRFARSARGSITVEAVLILPLLFWAYIATFAFFDAFRQQNVTMKASYTLADMVSRETEALTPSDIEGLNGIYDYLTTSNQPTWIRITSVYWDDTNQVFRQAWSYASRGHDALTDTTLQGAAELIPAMSVGDTVVLVETFLIYDPVFNVGLEQRLMAQTIVTRPRFASQVVFDPAA